jgi:hypothetical protein
VRTLRTYATARTYPFSAPNRALKPQNPQVNRSAIQKPTGHVLTQVKVAWLIYQKIIAAYADPNRRGGKTAMTKLIDSIRRDVPAGLEEIAHLS